MNQNLVELTAQNWESEVLQSTEPVLVDFWAAWCAPCRMVAPAIEALAEEYAGRVKVGKLNVDDHPEVAGQYGIRSIPTLMVFRGGEVVEQRLGALPRPQIAALLEAQVTAAANG